MKQLKPFKMFVPESDHIDSEFANKYCKEILSRTINKIPEGHIFTRPEIHELVRVHAIKIGYTKSFCSDENRRSIPQDTALIVLTDKGEILCDNGGMRSLADGQEIQWKDFLKLPPEDVETRRFAEYSSSGIKDQSTEPTTTDRNEKAWDLYLAIISNSHLTERYGLDDLRDMAFNETDNFLKQAGNK